MSAKWNIESTALVKPAQTIEASAVEIIEELSRFSVPPFAVVDQFVETAAMRVETRLLIRHFDSWFQTSLQMSVKIYEVGIDVVQEGTFRSQTERGRESTAEGLNVSPGGM